MARRVRPLLSVLCGASTLVIAGCGVGATGATCPEESTLTAQNFGTEFLGKYCNSCHSSTLKGSARQNAPAGVDFDTLVGVREEAKEIDAWSGAGPNGENTAMPPNGASPTTEERKKLSEWLACGAP